jgi:hypothetical protein
VHMCVCVHVCVCVCVCVCVRGHTHTRVCVTCARACAKRVCAIVREWVSVCLACMASASAAARVTVSAIWPPERLLSSPLHVRVRLCVHSECMYASVRAKAHSAHTCFQRANVCEWVSKGRSKPHGPRRHASTRSCCLGSECVEGNLARAADMH